MSLDGMADLPWCQANQPPTVGRCTAETPCQGNTDNTIRHCLIEDFPREPDMKNVTPIDTYERKNTMMKHLTTTISMTLCALLAFILCQASAADAQRRPRPAPVPRDTVPLGDPAPIPPEALYMTHEEGMCVAFGVFVENRGIERDQGYTLSQVLARTWKFDATYQLSQPVRQVHDAIIYAVFNTAHLAPITMRRN